MHTQKGYPKTKFIQKINYDDYKTRQKPAIPKLFTPVKTFEGVQLQGQIDQVFEKSFVFLMLGRPGSGKTSLLAQLINRPQFYGKKFDRILYVTPSDIPEVIHDQRVNTCRTFDIQWILKKIKQCSLWCHNVLLVIDDVISDIPANQRNAIKNIFYDRRHVLGQNGCLSIIITSQKYTCVPKWIRTCLDMFLSFSIQPSQIRTISEQLNTGKDSKTLNHLFRHLQKHKFVYFNLQHGKSFDSQFNQI